MPEKLAGGLILKPTLWTFAFFNNLRREAVRRDERSVILRREDGSYEGVLWNLCREEKALLTVGLSLPGDGEMTLLTRQVDEAGCNPLAAWQAMGEPASLSREQLDFLRQTAQPRCGAQSVQAADGWVHAEITLGINGVTHFTLTPRRPKTDYGYDAAWYQTHAQYDSQIQLTHRLASFPCWRAVISRNVALLRRAPFPLARMKKSLRILCHLHLRIASACPIRTKRPARRRLPPGPVFSQGEDCAILWAKESDRPCVSQGPGARPRCLPISRKSTARRSCGSFSPAGC